ncbi:unnamed protein product [Anisakis simplex]|uniref:Pre-mRNA-splicing factor SYF2 n=1 Tax=Anisakis simplex TaxID=6269 RepID=A0A0M3KB62_ANISI|nr:unnamed protein product [Anisakis simplex]
MSEAISGTEQQQVAASSSSSASSDGPAKKPDFMERFKQLHQRRQESRKLNHEQVVDEDRRSKLPKNYELRRKRQEWELLELTEKEKAEERGEDYERLKALKTQADLADRKEFTKRKKHNPDKGFSDYETMTLRQYERLSGNIKPDMKSYEKMKEIVGEEEFYPTSNTLITGSHYPTDAAKEKLAQDIRSQ